MVRSINKIKIIFALVMLCPCWCWGADIYVIKDINNPGKLCYKVDGFPSHDCSDGISDADLEDVSSVTGDGGNMYLSGGIDGLIYSGTEIDADSSFLIAYAVSVYGSTSSGHDGQVIIDGSGVFSHTLVIADTGIHLENLWVKGASSFSYYTIKGSRQFTATNIKVYGGARLLHLQHNVNLRSVFSRCIFQNSADTYYPIRIDNQMVNGADFNFCVFKDIGNIRIYEGTIYDFNNCFFISRLNNVLEISGGSPTVTMNNCIVRGYPGSFQSISPAFVNNRSAQGATFTLNYCNVPYPANPLNSTLYSTGITINNNITDDPMFTVSSYPVKVVMIIDDVINFTDFQALYTEASSRGAVASFACNLYGMTSRQMDILSGYISEGFEWSSHAQGLDSILNSVNGIDFSYTLQGGETTSTVEITENNIVLQVDGVVVHSLPLSPYVLGDLVNYIGANWNYVTINMHDEDYHTESNAKDLEIISTTNCVSIVHLTLDQDDYLQTEIVDSKSTIEAEVASRIGNYTVRTMVWPDYEKNDASILVAKSAGYLSVRGGNNGDYNLSNEITMFDIFSYNVSNLDGYSLSETGKAIKNAVYWMSDKGGILIFHGHDLTHFTQAQWGQLIDTVDSIPEAEIMTYGDAAEWIISNGTTSDSGLTYSVSQTDNNDYTLSSASPAIKFGTKAGTIPLIGPQSDINGNTFYFTPYDRMNIGADQTWSDADDRPENFGIRLNNFISGGD